MTVTYHQVRFLDWEVHWACCGVCRVLWCDVGEDTVALEAGRQRHRHGAVLQQHTRQQPQGSGLTVPQPPTPALPPPPFMALLPAPATSSTPCGVLIILAERSTKILPQCPLACTCLGWVTGSAQLCLLFGSALLCCALSPEGSGISRTPCGRVQACHPCK